MCTFPHVHESICIFVLNADISKHLPSKEGCTHKGRFTRVQTLRQTSVLSALNRPGTETLEDCCALGRLPRFAGLSFISNPAGPGERAVYSWQGQVGIGRAEEERMTV